MITSILRISAVSALVAALLSADPAGAVGAGTFTEITTPSHTLTFNFDSSRPSGHHLTVVGNTSADVTSVDVDCTGNSPSGPTSESLATNVPVTGEAFSANVNLTVMPQCRLRAVPVGVNVTQDYLGSYAGPILYLTGVEYVTAASTRVGAIAIDEQDDGIIAVEDAGQCGPALTATIAPPGMDIRGAGGGTACAFALSSANIRPSGTANSSSIKVDGHTAYLPFHVNSFLNQSPQSLGLTQPPLTVSFTRHSNGDATLTETAKLWRCSVDDTYPPTSTSCPSLVDTGVTFRRVSNMIRSAHQVRVRDTYTGTDNHSHHLNLVYEGEIGAQETGAVGYTFPGGSTAFHAAGFDQVVTGLGTRAGTMYVRSDLFAGPDDAAADTLGLTWSRGPQEVQFAHDERNFFGMPYALNVSAHGRAGLGFGYSGAPTTLAAKKLAGLAQNEMMAVPTIASPANGAHVQGTSTTVKGSVRIGANGLPTAVTVNGHAAHLSTVSATKATYAVTFSESLGTHTIKVVARDSAGNTAARSISVKNV